MKCRFIDTGSKDAYINMAIDESLFLNCNEPILRVYGWDKPSITIGYNQNPSKEINLKECNNHKIPIVRRITGGKAVLHDKEITYSFILPENSIELPQNVTESYRVIAKALLAALNILGIEAQIREQPERLSTPICFNSTNWYEIMVKNRKISGSAQRRLKGRILQHGPLLMDFDYGLNALLFSTKNTYSAGSLRERITSIKNEAKRLPSYRELSSVIKEGFKKTFKLAFYEDELTKEELRQAEQLREKKYSSYEWNFRKNG